MRFSAQNRGRRAVIYWNLFPKPTCTVQSQASLMDVLVLMRSSVVRFSSLCVCVCVCDGVCVYDDRPVMMLLCCVCASVASTLVRTIWSQLGRHVMCPSIKSVGEVTSLLAMTLMIMKLHHCHPPRCFFLSLSLPRLLLSLSAHAYW